jgi:hypothetical protein
MRSKGNQRVGRYEGHGRVAAARSASATACGSKEALRATVSWHGWKPCPFKEASFCAGGVWSREGARLRALSRDRTSGLISDT